MLSLSTGVPSGAPLDAKSGIRSFSVDGSSSAPDSWCRPASGALSMTAIDSGSPPCRLLHLRQPQRRRESRGTRADDQDIDFKRFTLGHYFCNSAISAGANSKRSPSIP